MSIDQLFRGKNILVFGLGLNGGGLGDSLFSETHGAIVRVTDLKSEEKLAETVRSLPESIEKSFGGHIKSDIEWADMIIRNPAVREDNQFILYAKKLGKPVVVSAALYLKYSTLKIIGITGTKGKTTTTTILGSILEAAFPGKILIGGNLSGTSLLQLLDQEDGEKKYSILELSSFQLAGLRDNNISPGISVITNIYQDHLDRYNNMQEYINDKLLIVKNQTKTDYTVLNKNNKYSSIFKDTTKAQVQWFDLWRGKIGVEGDHNRSNAAAASKVAQILGVNEDVITESIKTFTGLSYRLERIGTYAGVDYINDTTSTTPIATVVALNSLKQPIIIILGGATKNLSLKILKDALLNNTFLKSIIILGGVHNNQLLEMLENNKISPLIISRVMSMKEAVSIASRSASSGDTVLLSPGFASFDLFNNEFNRGDQFNKEVNKLKEQ